MDTHEPTVSIFSWCIASCSYCSTDGISWKKHNYYSTIQEEKSSSVPMQDNHNFRRFSDDAQENSPDLSLLQSLTQRTDPG
ncbi:unnamed protein product [Amaranthus hypochondriacus]